MAIFPKIQSPCPYRAQLSSLMDGDMCRMCKREVLSLDGMDDAQRAAFLSGCEEVCVSYRLPLGKLAAATAIAFAAAAAPMAAAAQDTSEIEWIIVGGIKDPSAVQFVEVDPVQVAADAAIPELPVVYEDDKAQPEPGQAPAPAAAPVKKTVAP